MCRRSILSSGDAPPTSPPPRALFISSAVFLSIFFVAFTVVAALALCCCRRRGRTSSSEHAALSGARGDRPFPVETLPSFAYACQPDEHGGAAASRECTVCLGAVKKGEMVRQLPTCRHVYHIECIDRWLAAHRTCPLCRSELDPCKQVNSGAPPPPTDDSDPPDHQPPV